MEQGFTLVEIMIVVAIIALLAAIAIPNLLRAKMTSNDALAQATLRAISTAAESFGTANNGAYPSASTDLTAPPAGAPPYLNTPYCDGTARAGYTFACNWSAGASGAAGSGYSIVATPVAKNSTGSVTSYTMTTGGVLTTQP